MKTCVFAGTFDPLTKGHDFVIKKCLETFDKVVVAVGVNVDKKPKFTLQERLEIIKRTYEDQSRVEVVCYEGMLVDFMKKNGIVHNVRGLRNEDDYKYETTMARYNEDMYPQIVTLFIPTPPNLTYVSSSAIRNIMELNSDFSEYLPENSIEFVRELVKRK